MYQLAGEEGVIINPPPIIVSYIDLVSLVAAKYADYTDVTVAA